MSPEFHQYLSPKRKREPSDSDYYSPSASPTSTISIASLQEARLREEGELGRHSPRAAVAGRFGELAIRGDRLPQPGLLHRDFQHELAPQLAQQRCSPGSNRDPKNMPESRPADNDEVHDVQGHQLPPELPAQGPTEDRSTRSLVSPSKGNSSTISPRKQHTPVSPSKIRKQRFSPPLADASLEDPFTWHDHEITGHNPTDPNDDGYGINGVGFRPTAAIAWARSQKRQKQVAEWKNRESREAREKRRARRNEDVGLDKMHGIHKSAIQKRVKFDV